ncbi:putative spanin [Escherichia phage vB_EcoP_PAS7]|uniref:Spanin n=1 Tax=Escherichia phage vB_EcoP_PAS7 TaxID=3053875 RepID=A0AA51VHE2_9CAUD|nr:putative spanin [Escherichia phage vB_EcoP_PAS7]
MIRAAAGLVLVTALTGCSAASALSGLVGTKPDLTVQAGAENTKQTVGLNSRSDSSTDTTIKDSNVGTLDTSTKKQSVTTGTINTERVQVVNNDSTSIILAGLAGAAVPIAILIIILLFRKLGRKGDVDESTN